MSHARMLKRTSLLIGVHLLLVTGLAYYAGAFSGRRGVLQFFGHLGPAMLFAGAGLISISGTIDKARLIRFEAYLALFAALLYILADSLVIHPPFGIFDGAGTAEQQHVSLNILLIGLSSLVLVTLRYTEVLPSIQVLIAAVAFAVVFSAHEQHSAAMTAGHNATILFVVLAAALRLFDRIFEYGVLALVAAHTFFGSQMGLIRFAEEVGIDGTTWSAYWITAGCLAAAAYLVSMRAQPPAAL